ncbi:MAG: LytR/AlgR family response regulator transcription factor [Putridiphycobacter sp.]
MKAIIIDDEAQAISALKLELKNIKDVEIIGTAQNVKSALTLFETTTPDLAFLDIQLTDGTGFDLLNQLNTKGITPKNIIFTTAYNQFAMESFKFNTIDYILKPIDFEDLERAVNKVRDILKEDKTGNFQMQNIEQMFKSMRGNTQIPLQSEGEIRMVEVKNIVRIHAQGNYSRFFFDNGMKPLMIAKTMKEFEQKLANLGFIRPHLSHIVNERHIKSYFSKDGGYLELTDGMIIPISQRKRQGILEYLKNF